MSINKLSGLKKLVAASLVFAGTHASADFVEKDSQYIYVNTPISTLYENKQATMEVVSIAQRVFINFAKKLQKNNLLPVDIDNFTDLDAIEKREKKLQAAINKINKWKDTAISKLPFKTNIKDLMPEAFFVSIGGKTSLNLGFGAGTSVSLGAVVLPVKRTTISRETGLVVSEKYTADVNLVFWGSPSLGLGVGGGMVPRFGAGFIWSLNDQFNDAKDFVGYGLGGTTTVGVGPSSLNLKAGIINSKNLSGIMDLAFISAAWVPGAIATAEFHASGSAIVGLDTVLSLFGDRAENFSNREMNDVKKAIRKEIEDLLKEVDSYGAFSMGAIDPVLNNLYLKAAIDFAENQM